jgi:ribosomal protein L3 glutamine methyltransferase
MSSDLNSQLESDLLNFRDWVRWCSSEFRKASLFYGHGSANDFDEAIYLVLWAVAQPWERLEQLWEVRLTSSEKIKIQAAVKERIESRCPLPYITGEAWFCGHRFIVNENVLVPRSPIAELIHHQFQPWLDTYPTNILDLCTGSGCIGLACAMEFMDADVDLIDISKDALNVAERNIALHGLSDRVTAIESDGLTALGSQQYDLIVSNPPYVSEAEYAELPKEYKVEPKLGLTSGEDGFDFVRNMLQDVHRFMKPQGLLVVEVGHEWQKFDALFSDYPLFWPEFENGGCGIFVLTREQLVDVIEKRH